MMEIVTDSVRTDLGGNARHGDSHSWCPTLWRYLVDRYAVRSVLDVGCGEGHAVFFFQRIGINAHGIEGLVKNIRRAVTPIALHDLLAAPYVMPVDLVWSCEVAEHIAEDSVDNYVRTLANGRVVAMTHGVPGQAGYHHVNCQPASYWVEKMKQEGYTLAQDMDVIKQVAVKEHTWTYFNNTGLVFVRD